MTRAAMLKTVALGALTGVRSMAGLTTLAASRGGAARTVLTVVALGEMVADKTPWIGNRTDAVPLAGRAFMGAAVGALVAVEQDQNEALGALVGAATAVAAAHLAYHVRTRLLPRGAMGGAVEDAFVLAVGSRYA
jgi:uncharacterized membrane protein